MQTLLAYLKKPYAEKGFIVGTFDLLLKLLTVFLWGYIAVILCTLFVDSIVLDYNPLNKLWWFSYCFLIFFGATWLAYIVLFVRDYYEPEEE
ncbi:hypothetical protein [Candidatus Avelusimicrobium gallicola]|uniref:Uncharacterized protein n=1 Tax=Candidatus Avelusimicrobium gallicola TaxID=2562704 RepID=A0A1Y4DD13_9BACT|nr:hypothetical protein [Elusimicrobium sp. An273]OUO56916.1 hypothetical protein B5F75_03470 [Elusimicrobium sp. An273]